MRRWLTFSLPVSLLSLGAAACGGDDNGGIDARTIDGTVASGAKPVITQVKWERAGSCRVGTRSDFMVTITATDADTPMNMLTVSGSVPSCRPPFDDFTNILSCPNAANYPGTVRVRDPQGNEDTQSFTMEPCTDGMVP